MCVAHLIFLCELSFLFVPDRGLLAVLVVARSGCIFVTVSIRVICSIISLILFSGANLLMCNQCELLMNVI